MVSGLKQLDPSKTKKMHNQDLLKHISSINKNYSTRALKTAYLDKHLISHLLHTRNSQYVILRPNKLTNSFNNQSQQPNPLTLPMLIQTANK